MDVVDLMMQGRLMWKWGGGCCCGLVIVDAYPWHWCDEGRQREEDEEGAEKLVLEFGLPNHWHFLW